MKKIEIIVLATEDKGLTYVMDRCHLTAEDTADAARQYAALFAENQGDGR